MNATGLTGGKYDPFATAEGSFFLVPLSPERGQGSGKKTPRQQVRPGRSEKFALKINSVYDHKTPLLYPAWPALPTFLNLFCDMRLLLLPLLLLCSAGTCVLAQTPRTADLTGTWQGTLLQNPSPYNFAESFGLSMNLRQYGIFVRGKAYVSFDDQYVELALSGHQLPNGSFRLTETEILRATDISKLNAEWCFKGYELIVSYTESGLVLTGPWWGTTSSGFTCVPGGVTLYLKKSRA